MRRVGGWPASGAGGGDERWESAKRPSIQRAGTAHPQLAGRSHRGHRANGSRNGGCHCLTSAFLSLGCVAAKLEQAVHQAAGARSGSGESHRPVSSRRARVVGRPIAPNTVAAGNGTPASALHRARRGEQHGIEPAGSQFRGQGSRGRLDHRSIGGDRQLPDTPWRSAHPAARLERDRTGAAAPMRREWQGGQISPARPRSHRPAAAGPPARPAVRSAADVAGPTAATRVPAGTREPSPTMTSGRPRPQRRSPT